MHNPDDISYKQYGERGILVEWKAEINPATIKKIVDFKYKIQSEEEFIEDCIVGYNSLLITYKNTFSFNEKVERLIQISTATIKVTKENYLWRIPVCYADEYGFDLSELSKQLKLTKEEIIKLHTGTSYLVYFIGFLPGFLYLGGLDSQLFIDRKSTPLLKVPKGAVAIGGEQTGIYPNESAGGWHIIGNTPVSFFSIKNNSPCFAQSGDKIQFFPIDKDAYQNIKELISEGNFQIEKERIHD
ncbi:5-oxoprolinase subunit PxpB [Tenacibaculum agarivorans]|uniref:5-oxoprolinase subunit PxpB n=1 Tax=Tenacibaculum agarivorans TaxID=1908389 RepID=UPI00094B90BD|nr:5-oxoprolinase subunit PxpB [Tenacibaculum agarivorans]